MTWINVPCFDAVISAEAGDISKASVTVLTPSALTMNHALCLATIPSSDVAPVPPLFPLLDDMAEDPNKGMMSRL
jgi:hypothetical protein